MQHLPDKNIIRELRQYLDAQEFAAPRIEALLGTLTASNTDEMQAALEKTSEITPLNLLVRLFVLGASIEEAALTLPATLVEGMLNNGLLVIEDHRVHAAITIVPVDDLLIASDAFRILDTEQARDFVLPASAHAAQFLRHLTFRDPVQTAMDLGCGCGIHAVLAARHADHVVATDISERALTFTRFNAVFNNLQNIDCRAGSLFEPVDNERFDLIISNPPFVIAPGETFVYRDNALTLDAFCATLLREAPRHLNEGGFLQMLGEWVEIENEPWEQRLESWFKDSGCDATVLRGARSPSDSYVRQRSNDLSASPDSANEWLAYLHDHNVAAIHSGAITLRRRSGANWLHILRLGGDISPAASFALRRTIGAQDFLADCSDDYDLLQARVHISTKVASEPQATNEQGQATSVLLQRGDGIPVMAEVDLGIMVFLQQLDGERTLDESIATFCELTGAPRTAVQGDLLKVTRQFVSQGFVVPADYSQ